MNFYTIFHQRGFYLYCALERYISRALKYRAYRRPFQPWSAQEIHEYKLLQNFSPKGILLVLHFGELYLARRKR